MHAFVTITAPIVDKVTILDVSPDHLQMTARTVSPKGHIREINQICRESEHSV